MKRAESATMLGNAKRALRVALDRINRVTLQEMRDVAAAFPLEPLTIGRLLPA